MSNKIEGQGTVELGGRTYLVAAATVGMQAAMARRIREHCPTPMQALQEVLAAPSLAALPEDDRRQIARELALEAGRAHLAGEGKVKLTDDMALEVLSRPEHAAFFAWLLLRKDNAVTLEQLRQLVTEDNALPLVADLMSASGMDSLGKAPGSSG